MSTQAGASYGVGVLVSGSTRDELGLSEDGRYEVRQLDTVCYMPPSNANVHSFVSGEADDGDGAGNEVEQQLVKAIVMQNFCMASVLTPAKHTMHWGSRRTV